MSTEFEDKSLRKESHAKKAYEQENLQKPVGWQYRSRMWSDTPFEGPWLNPSQGMDKKILDSRPGNYETRNVYATPVSTVPIEVTRDSDGDIIMVKQGDKIIASTCYAGGKPTTAPSIDLTPFRESVEAEYELARMCETSSPKSQALVAEAKQKHDRLLALIDASTPAAPGIDLRNLSAALAKANKLTSNRKLDRLKIMGRFLEPAVRALINASPKGDCQHCAGFGEMTGEAPGVACPVCNGTGKVDSPKGDTHGAGVSECGGCGNSDPDNRCLGCMHDFIGQHDNKAGGASDESN